MTRPPLKSGTVGLDAGEVRLALYSTDWPRLFRNESRRLRRRLPGIRMSVAHIGSTAIPGLPAKPVIDMAVLAAPAAGLQRLIRLFEAAGYVYKGEYGLKGRHFFTRGNPVTHHAHLVFEETPHWVRWLAFRDYLRGHPDERRRYAALKRAMAKRYARRRKDYTSAKTPYIQHVLALAMQRRTGWEAVPTSRGRPGASRPRPLRA